MEAPKSKDAIRKLHEHAVRERREASHKSLSHKEPALLQNLIKPSAVTVGNIRPQLRLVDDRRSHSAQLWRWASLHWSIPVSAGYGRRLRFLVTDANHNDALIGVIGLGDPVFALSARDSWIQWNKANRCSRLACVMDAFVLGAAPPYDILLGTKLIALLAISREVQAIFRERYGNRITLIGQRNPSADLALVTTISALGRSSVYNRLKSPAGELAYVPVGWTAGSGDFHLSGDLYSRLAAFAYSINADGKTERHESWTGNSFRNRREVVIKALDALGLPGRKLRIHGIRRQIFAAPLGANTQEFLRGDAERLVSKAVSAAEISAHWRHRWAVPRSKRIDFNNSSLSDWQLWD